MTNFMGQVFDRSTPHVPEVGGRRSGQYDLDFDAGAGQLVTQRLAEGQNEGFRASTNAVQNLRTNCHDGGDVDDSADVSLDERSRGGAVGS
jgi:hypothetical protein